MNWLNEILWYVCENWLSLYADTRNTFDCYCKSLNSTNTSKSFNTMLRACVYSIWVRDFLIRWTTNKLDAKHTEASVLSQSEIRLVNRHLFGAYWSIHVQNDAMMLNSGRRAKFVDHERMSEHVQHYVRFKCVHICVQMTFWYCFEISINIAK